MSDPLMDRLAALPHAAPDAVRAERTRVRCRAHLSARAAGAAAVSEARVPDGLWRLAIAVVGVLYMIEALAVALRVYG